jgi:L-alanine-DL-glutamate epimerase-like enolase superfamily enzyme
MNLDFFPVKLTNDRLVFIIKIDSGWGEIAPLVMDDQTYKTIHNKLCQLQQELKSIPPIELNDILSFTDRLEPVPLRYGVEQALLHHIANTQDRSLADLLCCDRQPLTQIPINALIPRVSPEEAERLTADFIDRGFKSIKIKVGSADIQADIDRVKAVRERSGKQTLIHLDANGKWEKHNVIANLRLLADYRIEYIEQPLATLADLAWLKKQSPIPIAADEAISSVTDLQKALALDCCHVVVIKPMGWGSLLQAQAGVRLCQNNGLEVVLTGTLEGPIGRWGVYELGRACHIDRACGLTGYDYIIS